CKQTVTIAQMIKGHSLVSDQGNSVAAKKVLLTLWDYMSTPDQIKRMQDIISNPKRLDGILILPT
ncbi:hypothetical protein UL57_26285, partial [Shigella boydii]